VLRTHRLAISTCAATFALGAFASAGAAQDSRGRAAGGPSQAAPKLALVERPAERFERSIEVHREVYRLELRLLSLRQRAEKLGSEPRRGPARSAPVSTGQLRQRIDRFQRIVKRAEREAAESDYTSVAGVSQATLDAIAACESGGDPGAVNPAGYYGKYQFDTGTWAAVGGSGNPAQASEAEQDYRAALLYSRAGASPWPVCGA